MNDVSDQPETPSHTLIVGASSGIARALINTLKHDHHTIDTKPATQSETQPATLTAISRSAAPGDWAGSVFTGAFTGTFADAATNASTDTFASTTPTSTSEPTDDLWLQTDYKEASIRTLCDNQRQRLSTVDTVIICNGMLHGQALQPEKRLADFSVEDFQTVLQCNAIIPLLWLQQLQRILPRNKPVNIVLFSARVGSIADNQLGGWYSYRSSKAALNMLVKSFAIEMARLRPQVDIVLFHPGTTDTPLSKPFQKNVAAEKLFTPEFVAQRLLAVLATSEPDTNIRYLDWDGKTIAW